MPKKTTKNVNIAVTGKKQGYWVNKDNLRKGERKIEAKGDKALVKRYRSGYEYDKIITGFAWTEAELRQKLAARARKGLIEQKSIARDLAQTHRITKTAPIITAEEFFSRDDWYKQDVLGIDTPPGMTLKEIRERYKEDQKKPKPPIAEKVLLDSLWILIRRSGDKGISIEESMKLTKLSKKDTEQLLIKLLESGNIYEFARHKFKSIGMRDVEEVSEKLVDDLKPANPYIKLQQKYEPLIMVAKTQAERSRLYAQWEDEKVLLHREFEKDVTTKQLESKTITGKPYILTKNADGTLTLVNSKTNEIEVFHDREMFNKMNKSRLKLKGSDIELIDHIPKASNAQLLNYVQDQLTFLRENSGYGSSYNKRLGRSRAGREIETLVERGNSGEPLKAKINELLAVELKKEKRFKPHTENGQENKGKISFYKDFLDSMATGKITRKVESDFDLMPTDENRAKLGSKLHAKYKPDLIDSYNFKYKFGETVSARLTADDWENPNGIVLELSFSGGSGKAPQFAKRLKKLGGTLEGQYQDKIIIKPKDFDDIDKALKEVNSYYYLKLDIMTKRGHQIYRSNDDNNIAVGKLSGVDKRTDEEIYESNKDHFEKQYESTKRDDLQEQAPTVISKEELNDPKLLPTVHDWIEQPLKSKIDIQNIDTKKAGWTMTRNEFSKVGGKDEYAHESWGIKTRYSHLPENERKDRRYDYAIDEVTGYRISVHEAVILKAMKEGKTIPKNVLKDYPEITNPSARKANLVQAKEDLKHLLKTSRGRLAEERKGRTSKRITPKLKKHIGDVKETAKRISKVNAELKKFETVKIPAGAKEGYYRGMDAHQWRHEQIEQLKMVMLADDPEARLRSLESVKKKAELWRQSDWKFPDSVYTAYRVEAHRDLAKLELKKKEPVKKAVDKSKSIAAGKNLYLEKYDPKKTHLALTKTMTDMQKRRLIKLCKDNSIDTRELDPSLKYDENQEIIDNRIELNEDQQRDERAKVEQKIQHLEGTYHGSFSQKRIKERAIDEKSTEPTVITKEDLIKKRKKKNLEEWEEEPYLSKIDVEDIDTAK